MIKKFIALFFLFEVVGVFASAASCSITVSPSPVDFTSYSNPGRVTVFGSGLGSNFDSNTYVQLNCNTYGLSPGANQNSVTANRLTLISSQIDYSGYCTYKQGNQDAAYTVTATVFSGGQAVASCQSQITASGIIGGQANDNQNQQPTQSACGGLNQTVCSSCPSDTKGKTCFNGCNAPYAYCAYCQGFKGYYCVACQSGQIYYNGACQECGSEGEWACGGTAGHGTVCNSGLVIASNGLCVKQTPVVQNQTLPSTQNRTTSPTTNCGGKDQYACSQCTSAYNCFNGCNAPYAKDSITGYCKACESWQTFNNGACISPSQPANCGGKDQYACTTCTSANCVNGCYAPYIKDKITNYCKECESWQKYGNGTCGTANGNLSSYPNNENNNSNQGSGQNGNNNDNQQPPALPANSQTSNVNLYYKWNTIGIPVATITGTTDSCNDITFYSLNKNSNAYEKVDFPSDSKTFVGRGYWAKVSSDCSLQFTGDYLTDQTISLTSGWNLISVQSPLFANKQNIQNNCQIKSGPYTYDASLSKYVKSSTFIQGNGYFIKVAADCTISTSTNDQPPALPVETTSTKSNSKQPVAESARYGQTGAHG